MNKYPAIANVLRTAFNVEDGLSEEVSRGLYLRNVEGLGPREALVEELRAAFADPVLSWKALLENDEYEVMSADTEDEARAFVQRNLWDPLFDASRTSSR